ncbi:MAG: MBL fold metallo-hydrolase [Planctomycetota bacterium]|jgi:phosphoribosyl 1,2-cyclic phosphodiesterase
MPKNTIRFCTLESGSSGNSTYCETEDGSVIIDAGISCRKVLNHLSDMNISSDKIDGILLTHHHSDHVKCTGALSRGLQKPESVPVFMTPGTRRSIPKNTGHIPIRTFKPGDNLCLGGFQIKTLSTPHDAEDSIAVVLQRGDTRLGIFTDLGHCFDGMRKIITELDAVIIESNYDPDMLDKCAKYPESVKARIRGSRGHLSNLESAKLIKDHASSRLKFIILSHLSENNNMPDIALDTHKKIAEDLISQDDVFLDVAPRFCPSKMFEVCCYPEETKKEKASV